MQRADLFAMAWQNLKRRRSRTFLTMLGVVIGVCSIVVMVSIGLGINESSEAQLSQMGDLTTIQIYNYGGGNDQTRLDDAAMEAIRQLPYCAGATAKQELGEIGFGYTLSAGANQRYKSDYLSISAVDFDQLEALGYKLEEGQFPGPGSANAIPVLAGSQTAYNFYDSYRPEGMNRIDIWQYDENGVQLEPEPAFFNPLETGLELSFYAGDENGTPTKYALRATGLLKSDMGLGYETEQGLLIDLKDMARIRKELARASGQAAPKETNYTQALVKADDISHVAELEEAIHQAGFPDTSSMQSMRESMQESTRMLQLMLAGIGAVSLFVAAIGIANTMVMSISERTREIGIMKALGCRLGDIRLLFLAEAGIIGLAGGLLGALLSLAISSLINVLASSVPVTDWQTFWQAVTGYGTRVSVVPLWLLGLSVVFAVLVGLISGFSPARKAVKVPALEAIKHE